MKRLLCATVSVFLLSSRVFSDATDIPYLTALVASNSQNLVQTTLTAGYASVDVYYTMQQAYNAVQTLQNMSQSLQKQIASLAKRDWSNSQSYVNGISDAVASFQSIQNQMNSMSFMFGGQSYSLQDLIPAETHAAQVAQSVEALAQALTPYPGESPIAQAQRIQVALKNIDQQFKASAAAQKSIGRDIVAISGAILKKHDDVNTMLNQLVQEAQNGAGQDSLITQFQIMQQYMGKLVSMMNDANTLNASSQLQTQAAQQQEEKARLVAQAQAEKSVTITYPDQSTLDQQIARSGISVDDLTGNTPGATGYVPMDQ